MSENSELYFFIGLRIKQARTNTFGHRLMTQSELAKALNVSFQQIQKYEKATNKISIEKLDKIEAQLDTKLDKSEFYKVLGLIGTVAIVISAYLM